jgi:hypothetical protein
MISDNHEHLSDASDLPPQSSVPTLLRAPRNIVSNRELASLGSTLAPGMHLSLHNHLNAMPTRVRKSDEGTETPVKLSITGNSFMIDEDDTSEPAAKRKRTANKKTSVPKKGAPRRAREIKMEQRAPVEEDEQGLFPEPLIKPDRSLPTPTPAHRKAVLKNDESKQIGDQTFLLRKRNTRSDEKLDTTSITQSDTTQLKPRLKENGDKEHKDEDEEVDAKPDIASVPTSINAAKSSPNFKKDADADGNENENSDSIKHPPGKRQTRNDATVDTAPAIKSKSKSKSRLADAYADESDGEYCVSNSPSPAPAPAPSKKKLAARSTLRGKVATTLTAKSTSLIASSTPARNIYGFSPRKTRSGGMVAGSRAKAGKAGSAKAKGKGKGKGEDETEPKLGTIASEEEKAAEKDGGTGKRLRSKG